MTNGIPESIRNKIAKMIDEASEHITMPDKFKHMFTQVCFELYKSGFKDGCRTCKFSCEKVSETFLGK